MPWYHDRIPLGLFQTHMGSHTSATEVYFDSIPCNSDVHTLADQIKRDGITVQSICNGIVVLDLRTAPCRRLIWCGRQRLHEFTFFLLVCAAAASFPRFKGLVIKTLQLFSDCIMRLLEGKEALVPDSSKDPRSGKLD